MSTQAEHADVVQWSHGDDVFTITLNRPPANALGMPIIDGLNRAFDHANGARVVVITSNLEGFFAAGADIKVMANADLQAFEAYGDSLRAVLNRIEAYEGITIAAIEGLALGGGMELALACTFRVVGSSAQFGLPEVKLGLIPGAGGTQRLTRMVGRARTLDLILTARQINGQEAEQLGIADRLVEAGAALEAAYTFAGELLRSSSLAQLAAIRSVNAAGSPEGFDIERTEVGQLFVGPHGQEGLAAFLQKRKPDFQ